MEGSFFTIPSPHISVQACQFSGWAWFRPNLTFINVINPKASRICASIKCQIGTFAITTAMLPVSPFCAIMSSIFNKNKNMQTKHKVLSFLLVGVVAAGVFGGFNVNVSDLMTKVIATKVTKDLPATRAEVAVAIAEYLITEDEDLADYYDCEVDDIEDISEDDLNSICYVVDNGIMLPDSDGYFNPDASVKRVEAARYFSVAHDYLVELEYLEEVEVPDVCTAKTKTTKASCMYKDVKDSDGFSYDVANLVVNGISDVKAYKGKAFNPNKTFTKSQFKIWDKNFQKLLGW